MPKWGGREKEGRAQAEGMAIAEALRWDWTWHVCMHVRGTARTPGGGEEWERRE